jgi:glutamate-1-semialdehyde 2,1-aminomutase
MPGGVSSPVRAFRGVGGEPFVVQRGEGPYLYDVDGKRYIDYVGSWGPLIFGHADPELCEALTAAVLRGSSYGCPSEPELELCELLVSAVPGLEMVRLVNSGTEATMSALRLARAATGREMVLKFDGAYHGHADAFLVKAGSGLATLGEVSSAGVPSAAGRATLSLAFNDLEAVRQAFEAFPKAIAAVMVEPVVGNMGCVPPLPGFLEGLRELCTAHGALLIFDEVMTGFRVALGGCQQRYGVRADLITLGKIIGGGLPVGAYGGRRALMEQVAPSGPVYQAGTLSGNPLACTAGAVSLRRLIGRCDEVYGELERKSAKLEAGLLATAKRADVPIVVNRVGSMLSFFFGSAPVRNWDDAARDEHGAYARFFHAMLAEGVYLAPSRFECAFVSTAHQDAQLEQTIAAAELAFVAARG